MTASEEHQPDRREAQRRAVEQPAYYGENRSAIRREEDLPEQPVAQAPVAPDEVAQRTAAQQDYAFITGLIEMEHTG